MYVEADTKAVFIIKKRGKGPHSTNGQLMGFETAVPPERQKKVTHVQIASVVSRSHPNCVRLSPKQMTLGRTASRCCPTFQRSNIRR